MTGGGPCARPERRAAAHPRRYQEGVEAPRVLIGWNEYVDIPEWGIKRLRAKVDTGARSSALHVENIEELPRDRVRFDVVLHRRNRERRVHVKTHIVRRGRVRSSTGHYEQRIFVRAPLQIGPIEREVEVSLVDREKMIFRMLLGRSALAGPFVIDPAHRNLLSPRKRLDTPARKKTKKKKTRKKTTRKTGPKKLRARTGASD